jgi:hypothetical protein
MIFLPANEELGSKDEFHIKNVGQGLPADTVFIQNHVGGFYRPHWQLILTLG